MRNFKYFLMVLIGGTLYGTMSSFVKLSYHKGYHAAELSFFQAFVSALLLGLLLMFSKAKNRIINRNEILPLIITGATIGLTNFIYYQSVSYIPASLAIIILMQFTWISLLLEWVLFKKKPGRIELITIAFILIGTVLAGNIFEIGFSTFSWQGLVLAILAALTYAIYVVANSRVGIHINWLPKSTFIMLGSALCIFLINVKSLSSNFSYISGDFFMFIIFLAVIGTTIPTALFASGIPKIGAGISSILMTVELPVAVVCAHLVLKEQVSILQILGISVMLGAICVMNYYKSKSLKHSRPL